MTSREPTCEPTCEVVTTRSGARAMRDLATGELMHPVVGPLVEAHDLYITPSRLEARLATPGTNAIVLFDVGLGAGSNAISAWKLSERRPASTRRLEIVSFDRTTSAMELALAEANALAFGFESEARDAARAILANGTHETTKTRWRLILGDLPSALVREPETSADLVFWDPFSPRSNPSLWTMAAFTELRARCRDRATLHTYSAATSTRSALLLAGFAVGAGDATGVGKQTTTAAVSLDDLERPLDRRWLARLARSSSPFPSDAPTDALSRVARLAQFASVA